MIARLFKAGHLRSFKSTIEQWTLIAATSSDARFLRAILNCALPFPAPRMHFQLKTQSSRRESAMQTMNVLRWAVLPGSLAIIVALSGCVIREGSNPVGYYSNDYSNDYPNSYRDRYYNGYRYSRQP
jgi:hypothetical protein